MARIDKTDSAVGVIRAPLAGAWTGSATPKGVGLDANGRMVVGAGQSGIVGVICQPRNKAAGDIVDIIKLGELVEFGGVAGSTYTADTTTGVIATTAADATHIKVGFTVEANRFVVQVTR